MQARVYLKIRAGAIDSSAISISSDEDSANAETEKFDRVLKDKNIHDIDDFNNVLTQVEHGALTEVLSISRWLNTMFGKTSSMSQWRIRSRLTEDHQRGIFRIQSLDGLP